jgi:hypothetical protein
LRSVLRSTGDNLRFRTELVELAERVLVSVDGDGSIRPGESGPPGQADAAQAVESIGGSAPGGIPPSRLEWLCQPAQIERTLHLLFYLNHWAKAREQLLYADRQGLYKVKAAVVQQAVAAELINPAAKTLPAPGTSSLPWRMRGSVPSPLRPARPLIPL